MVLTLLSSSATSADTHGQRQALPHTFQAISHPARASSGTVLIVDDNDGVRTVATLSLERAGFRVASARNGEEGMALMLERGGDFDAVLLDITMPLLSGAQTCRLIRKLRPELPIVLTSGHAEQDAQAGFDRSDVAGFLQKPFSPANLVEMIQVAVQNRPQEGR